MLFRSFAGEESTPNVESSPKASSQNEVKSEVKKEESKQRPVESAAPKVVKQTAGSVLNFLSPVDKAVTQKFSGKNMIYSKTMKDWRTHNGTDFGAKKGDTVKAVADGKVKDVIKHDLYGNTLIIMHGDIETYYCGLNEINVKKNDEVKQSQKIGTVGNIPFESEDAVHLHLEMKKNDKYIDPLSIIK